MQKKRNIMLMVSLVILIFTNAVVYFGQEARSALRVDKNMFRVDDLTSIDRIKLSAGDKLVDLTFDGARWKVNGHSDADRNLVDLLFATIQQAEPKRPVASRIQDSIRQQLDAGGVHVELFATGDPVKAFVAGGNARKTQTYFKETGKSIPYIMTIPGYRVYVAGILELNEYEWRDKNIFGFNWRNFKQLEAVFPDGPDGNYRVVMRNQMAAIDGLSEVDTTKLNNFLDAVSLLQADRFKIINVDSLQKENPIMRITIQDIANREYSLDLYRKGDAPGQYEGILKDATAALFDARKVEGILKTRQHFQIR